MNISHPFAHRNRNPTEILNQFRVTVIVISVAIFAYTAQIESGSNEEPRARKFKSTHQIEWERHKDFIRTDRIPAFQGPPMALAPKGAAPDKEIFGYLPYWVYANHPNLNYDLLTTIAYFGVEVDSQGNLSNLRDWPAPGLVNRAHGEGVRVVLTAFNFNANALTSVLGNADRRANLIANLLTQVQIAHADGVNIDFEGVPSGQRENLTMFMAELADAFHSAIPGSFVTIFTPSVDWSDAFDYSLLAQITDGLVISGYDYHWSTAPTAGPVSPLTGTRWGFYNVTWTVDDYLSKTSSPSKLILGLPFYGYEWPTESDALEAKTTDLGIPISYSEAYSNALQFGRLWDEESQTPWYKYNDGNWRQGWYDDSLSLAKKFQLVENQNLKGIGIWALSYDGDRQELQAALAEFLGRTPTSVEIPVTESTIPNEFELAQNYPNPFNPSTNIAFQLTNSVPLLTKLQIYDLLGREIIILIDEPKSAGRYSVQWDGRDRRGDLVASGTYISRLQVGDRVQSKKMTLLR